MKKKVLLILTVSILFSLSCEIENEFKITEIKASKYTVRKGETIQIECNAVAPHQYRNYTIFYHWEISGFIDIFQENSLGQVQECNGFNCEKKIEITPGITGTYNIEVLAYLDEAVHPVALDGQWLVYVVDQIGSVTFTNCFDYEERGELWDIADINITVVDN